MRSANTSELISSLWLPSDRAPTARCDRARRLPPRPPSIQRSRAGWPAGRLGPAHRARHRMRQRRGSARRLGLQRRRSAARRLGRRARSHAWLGKMARQLSIQRLTCAPVASSARKRAGTATRPFASMECRNSPVNTPLPLDLRCRSGARSPPGSAFASPIGRSTALSPHLAPLWATSAASYGTSAPRQGPISWRRAFATSGHRANARTPPRAFAGYAPGACRRRASHQLRPTCVCGGANVCAYAWGAYLG